MHDAPLRRTGNLGPVPHPAREEKMRTLVLVTILTTALPAHAKPWQTIEPGVSKRADVLKRFGEPSRTVTTEGKEVIAYFEQRAIKGTSQAQFRVDPATKVVERIDVFPGPVIEKDTVEESYGPACPAGKAPASPCYLRKLT